MIRILIFIQILCCINGKLPENVLDKSIGLKRNLNGEIITIGYVAGVEHYPGEEFNSYVRPGRYLSGALLNALRKINQMAQTNETGSPLPYKVQMNLKFYETYGQTKRSIKAVADMCVENETWAVIGPQETCRTEADIAAAYNFIMISHYCTDNILSENPEKYSTFVKIRPQSSGLADVLVSFLKNFNWTNVAVVASEDKEHVFLLQNCITALENNKIRILHKKTFKGPIINLSQNDFEHIVTETYKSCRIYVFIGFDFELIVFLSLLDSKGLMDTGDYFVIGVMIRLQVISKTIFFKIKRQGLDPKFLMRNIVIISPIIPERELFDNLQKRFKALMSLPPFNVILENDKRGYIPIESSYLYDAVWLYAIAVGQILRNPKLGSPKNGTLIKSLLINYKYQSVFGYFNRIDSFGISNGNYTVKQPTFNNSDFELVSIGLFEMSEKSPNVLNFKYINSKAINLIKGVPLDKPKCDFDGSLCKMDWSMHTLIYCIVVIIFLIIIVISAFKIRSNMFEKELERFLWKIDRNKEIDSKDSSLLENFSFITRPNLRVTENGYLWIPVDEDMTQFFRGNSFIDLSLALPKDVINSNLSFGIYKNQEVVIKRIYFSAPLCITRTIKKELKVLREITFINLNKFLGAIIEHQETCVVWEFCDRGSLQDVLYCTNLTTEYPIFLSSFALDIIKGLMFLHENQDICFHGNLKSSNCVVDSRWTVKLTDYGMTAFLNYRRPSPDTFSHDYFMSLFWTAPEILRFLLQYKCHQNQFLIDLKQQLSEENKFVQENSTDENCFFVTNKHGTNDYSNKLNRLDTLKRQRGDIFSFGVLFYELHSCQIPYFSNYMTQNSAREIIRRVIVLNDEFRVPYRPKLSLISSTDQKVTDLVKICWQEQSTQRPTVKTVFNKIKTIYGDKKNLVECMKEKMTLYTKNLEKEVMKRTEELREEKKQNEELLYQMLPIPVAEQLRQHKEVEAEAFDNVTIYFSDIVGFTELAGSCTPFEVVKLLNQLYTSFDGIIENYNVYKVETIGDSYMVVSGLPKFFEKHAREMANMSLRLLEEITKGFVIPSINHQNEVLKLRIGLHSGPCCAGVVGTRNPRYCLFGDTVNMASRMESTGEACKIHCSSAFISEIMELNEFEIIRRGSVEVKGKGTVETFWLIGKIPENTFNYQIQIKKKKITTNDMDILTKDKYINNIREIPKPNYIKSTPNKKKIGGTSLL